MKNHLFAALLLACGACQAANPELIHRAVNCELRDDEVPTFTNALAQAGPDFKRPSAQYGAPVADVHDLAEPVSAFGFRAQQLVIMPTRVLLAISGQALAEVVKTLDLTEAPYAPASREVRPTVTVVALRLSHQALQNKVLLGCEYAQPASALWPGER